MEVVALERQALPLGQRVHHLAPVAAHRGDVEAHGALHAVEVVVQAGFLPHEQRGRHAPQIQRVAELLLEIVLDKFDGELGVKGAKRRSIALGDRDFIHIENLQLPTSIRHTAAERK